MTYMARILYKLMQRHQIERNFQETGLDSVTSYGTVYQINRLFIWSVLGSLHSLILLVQFIFYPKPLGSMFAGVNSIVNNFTLTTFEHTDNFEYLSSAKG